MKRIVMQAICVAGWIAIFAVAAGPAAAQGPPWGREGKMDKAMEEARHPGPKDWPERSRNDSRYRRDPGPDGPGDRPHRDFGGRDDSPLDRYYREAREPQGPPPKAPSHHQRDRGPDGPGDRYYRFFGGRDRSSIDRYYADRYRHGKCPPGLVKKGNRCVPPGHARRWVLHRPLPRDVIYYDLPQDVLVHLGPPPAGHRFVRVAQDILLLSIGTGMVVDALEDLGRID